MQIAEIFNDQLRVRPALVETGVCILDLTSHGTEANGLHRLIPERRLAGEDRAKDGPQTEHVDPLIHKLDLTPRLSGSIVARMADPQAEGDSPRPSRTVAGGSGGGVERPPGESATAIAVAVVHYPVVGTEENLDAAAEEDDGEGWQVSCRAGEGPCGGLGARRLGWLRGLRHSESP
jgi:hypothetical protein